MQQRNPYAGYAPPQPNPAFSRPAPPPASVSRPAPQPESRPPPQPQGGWHGGGFNVDAGGHAERAASARGAQSMNGGERRR